MSWKLISSLISFASAINDSDETGEDVEGDAGEEDDSGNQMDKKPRLFKREHSHMDDGEGMPPFQLSARLA